MMVTLVLLVVVVLLAAIGGYLLVQRARRAEATVTQLLHERDDALQQLAAEQSDTRVWPRVADLTSQLAAASAQALAWQTKSVAAAALVGDLRQQLEAQAHATPVGRNAPRPVETHDTWTLRLCDAHGHLRTEVSIHRADPPDRYVYGEVRYRALGRIGRVVNFQEVLPHG